MSELYVMITVSERSIMPQLIKLYESAGALVNMITLANGTGSSTVLETFGLEKTEKAVCHTIVTDETYAALRRDLKRKFRLDIPGTGIVFLVPMSSIGGKKQMSFLLSDQKYTVSEESTLKNTEQELIVIISDQGYSDLVMDAAREAGARGGTVLHAKGTGMKGADKFFGFTIAEDKEMIYIVSSRTRRDPIMRSIIDNAGMKSKAHAICFSLPVTGAMGLRSEEDDDE
ncbi:MAG: P-II family nitrogen regulator [Oscillospiraceae bacterium]|nr:P-II family nitrogen regulator [Oscillospiraceae bacterium]